MQALDLVGVQRDRGVAPAEGDVGVMALVLGEPADPVDEAERLAKILELVGALDPLALVEQRPAQYMLQQTLGRLGLTSGAAPRPCTARSSSRSVGP